MASLSLRLIFLSPILFGAAFAQELPKGDGKLEFDVESKLMLNDLPDASLPANADAKAPLDVARLTTDLERAKKNAASREKLCKSGVLSKLEAEQGALRVVRLTRDLESARQQALVREVEKLREQAAADETGKAALAEAEKNLAAATIVATEAATKWEAAQRAAAELRVQRERKLLVRGASSRAQVQRAEAALQSLTRPAP